VYLAHWDADGLCLRSLVVCRVVWAFSGIYILFALHFMLVAVYLEAGWSCVDWEQVLNFIHSIGIIKPGLPFDFMLPLIMRTPVNEVQSDLRRTLSKYCLKPTHFTQ
jgi:hypothetical protein